LRGEKRHHDFSRFLRFCAFQEDIVCWLELLSKPVAVLVCSDIRGQPVLNLYRRVYLAAPEGVRVIGVDVMELFANYRTRRRAA